MEAWSPVQQQVRSISKAAKTKAAKEEERNVTVKLLKDMPRWGRAGMVAGVRERKLLKLCRHPRDAQPVAYAKSMVPPAPG